MVIAQTQWPLLQLPLAKNIYHIPLVNHLPPPQPLPTYPISFHLQGSASHMIDPDICTISPTWSQHRRATLRCDRHNWHCVSSPRVDHQDTQTWGDSSPGIFLLCHTRFCWLPPQELVSYRSIAYVTTHSLWFRRQCVLRPARINIQINWSVLAISKLL